MTTLRPRLIQATRLLVLLSMLITSIGAVPLAPTAEATTPASAETELDSVTSEADTNAANSADESTYVAPTISRPEPRIEARPVAPDSIRTAQPAAGFSSNGPLFSAKVTDFVVTSNSLIAASESGLATSTDEGATWTLHFELPTLAALAQDPGNPQTLFASGRFNSFFGNTAVFRSEDGGTSWTVVFDAFPQSTFSPPRVTSLAVTIGASPTVLAIVDKKLYVSSDQAASWQLSEAGFPSNYAVVSLTADATRPGVVYVTLSRPEDGVYRSADNGASWALVNASPPFSSANVLAVDPLSGRVYLGRISGSGRGVIYSDNGIDGWTATNLTTHIYHLSVGPDGVVYAGEIRNNVHVSTDSGLTWTPSITPPAGTLNVLAADPAQANLAYAGSDGGPYRSADGGLTWELRPGAPPPLPAELPTLYLVDSTNSGGGVWRTNDLGESWQQLNTGLAAPRESRLIASALNQPARLYLSATRFADFYLYRSDDGGLQWQGLAGLNDVLAAEAPGIARVNGLAVHPTDPEIVLVTAWVCCNQRAVYRTSSLSERKAELSVYSRHAT